MQFKILNLNSSKQFNIEFVVHMGRYKHNIFEIDSALRWSTVVYKQYINKCTCDNAYCDMNDVQCIILPLRKWGFLARQRTCEAYVRDQYSSHDSL